MIELQVIYLLIKVKSKSIIKLTAVKCNISVVQIYWIFNILISI